MEEISGMDYRRSAKTGRSPRRDHRPKWVLKDTHRAIIAHIKGEVGQLAELGEGEDLVTDLTNSLVSNLETCESLRSHPANFWPTSNLHLSRQLDPLLYVRAWLQKA